jgi:hypothetical protein
MVSLADDLRVDPRRLEGKADSGGRFRAQKASVRRLLGEPSHGTLMVEGARFSCFIAVKLSVPPVASSASFAWTGKTRRTHSLRSATIGSTIDARRAGSKFANRATPASSTVMLASEMGS